ncbi:MAG: aldo/keto reductase [Erysipelotrichaceae bacterium]|jgi:diketogulonate reductase-like aldo/keto reductase|nr:aldo/keto reductase [Erysipelotrichaceae bacterium]
MSSFTKKTAELHNGITIPTIGYRIDKDHPEDVYKCVRTALDAGFRSFDLPVDGESEKQAGKAFKDSGIERYELFLSLKLANEDHGFDAALRAMDHSLKRVGTDFADLYLIDWPNPKKFRDQYETIEPDTWRALETMYKNGTAHSIGLANYEARHIEFNLEHSEISPMVNQARIYPGFPFENNLNCANEHKILTEAFLPPDFTSIIQSKELKIFAEKYQATAWQIVIRYQLEKGCAALCQCNDPEELKHIDHVFDFSLVKEDMLFLDSMKNYGPENIDPDTCDF